MLNGANWTRSKLGTTAQYKTMQMCAVRLHLPVKRSTLAVFFHSAISNIPNWQKPSKNTKEGWFLAKCKVLDALARIPGYSGQNADAVKAYTQVRLADFEGETETWVELPQDRWPKSWFRADGSCKYVRPVVRLLANLYGHPLAGLWWEKHCHNKVIKCGYQRLQGWECLYQHPQEKAALSVYVDDLKLCGPCGALPRLWKELMKHLKLEPPTEFHDSVYLGCQQQDYETSQEDIDNQSAYWNKIFADESVQFKTAGETLLTELRESNLSKRQERKRNKDKKTGKDD